MIIAAALLKPTFHHKEIWKEGYQVRCKGIPIRASGEELVINGRNNAWLCRRPSPGASDRIPNPVDHIATG